MQAVKLNCPAIMQPLSTWSGMDQRQHGEQGILVLKLYDFIRCQGEGSSSRINVPLKWQLIA